MHCTQPIALMYHGITDNNTHPPEDRETGAEIYDVSIGQFRAQLEFLKAQHYRTITIQKNLDVFSSKEIFLTFDDGEKNNATLALPALKELGFTGHFFLIAKRIGKDGYMGWEEIRQLISAGMIIGSHGFSHEILTNLLDTQIQEELSASKKYIESNLGIRVEGLSIPRGFCNEKIIKMAKEAGYKYIFLSEQSKHIQQNCFSRIAIKSHWPLKRFRQALEGRIPFKEQTFLSCKNRIKKIMGDSFYDWIRRMLLKI